MSTPSVTKRVTELTLRGLVLGVLITLIFTAANYAYAVAIVALASVLSAIIACRYLNRLDLVGALKAAE